MTIDWDLLGNLSYKTRLGKSLRNTLRKFNETDLFDEIDDLISYMTKIEGEVFYTHRIKSLQSCRLKYQKYYPFMEVEKTFNDILGIRIIIDNYEMVDSIKITDKVKIADMRVGKADDDGYRAIHMYYQKDHFHYPIEIQFMTANDRQFNEWLHIYLYKYNSDNAIGYKLRELYDCGIIITEEDFRKEMKKLCAI